jgi:isopenicillin N synthase-like dioxygenase
MIELKEPPKIDLSQLQKDSPYYRKTIQEIKQAALDPGFFCLENISEKQADLFENTKKQMDTFFSIDNDDPIKLDIDTTDSDNSYGWMPMFQEPAYEAGTLAHLESFDFGRKKKPIENPSYRPNRWPKITSFKKDIRSIWDEYTSIGMLTLNALNEAFMFPNEFLKNNCSTQDLSTMRLLNYPKVDRPLIDKNNVGISAHTDFECITLISQTSPGLEVRGVNRDWYKASTDDKKIMVIFGKMLEIWSNGMIKATPHRVMNREWQRYSIVMFFGVNDEVIVEPLEQFTEKVRKKYAPIKQRAHIDEEIKKAIENRDSLSDAK